MLAEEVKELVATGEGPKVEFVTLTGGRLVDSLFNTVSAFSNCDGGHILIGVADDGTIDGVAPAASEGLRGRFANRVSNSQSVSPPLSLSLEEVDIDGKLVLSVYVPSNPQPVRFKTKTFERNEDANVEITGNPDKMAALYQRKFGLSRPGKSARNVAGKLAWAAIGAIIGVILTMFVTPHFERPQLYFFEGEDVPHKATESIGYENGTIETTESESYHPDVYIWNRGKTVVRAVGITLRFSDGTEASSNCTGDYPTLSEGDVSRMIVGYGGARRQITSLVVDSADGESYEAKRESDASEQELAYASAKGYSPYNNMIVCEVN